MSDSNSTECPECGSTKIIQGDEELTCENCGLVFTEDTSSNNSWQTFSDAEDSKRVGTSSNADSDLQQWTEKRREEQEKQQKEHEKALKEQKEAIEQAPSIPILWHIDSRRLIGCEDEIAVLYDEDNLYGIDLQTGKEKWHTKHSNLIGEGGWRDLSHLGASYMDWKVVLSNQIVFVLTSEENLVALSVNTGEQLWEYKPQFEHNQRIALTSNTGYLTNDTGAIESISLHDGSINWTAEDTITAPDWQSWFPTAPVLHDNVVISATNSDDGLITARNQRSGDTVWEFATRETPSQLLMSEGRLFAGTVQGDVYALDPKNGEQVWRHRITEYGDPEDPSEITRPTEPIIGIETTESEAVITGRGFYSSVVDLNSGANTFEISAIDIGDPTTKFTSASIVTDEELVLTFSGSVVQSYTAGSPESVEKDTGWRFKATDRLRVDPVISKDGQYLVTTDTRDTVCLLDLESGNPSSTAKIEPDAEKFILADGIVLIDTKQSVYALEINN